MAFATHVITVNEVFGDRLRTLGLADDKLSIVIRGRITFIGKIKVDPRATPKTIDFEYTEGPGGVVGKIKRGIYKLDKDRLEICWNSDGDKNRPRKFTTKVTTGRGFLHEIFEKSKDE